MRRNGWQAMFDSLAGPSLWVGMAAVIARNAWLWHRDRAGALELRVARRAPLPALVRTPRVSVLVAAWNEAAWIEGHVESVLGLRYPELEYVLCAGGSDGTYGLAIRYARPGVVVLEQRAGEGKQAALRRCLARASGEIMFLTDADCVLDDATFERTLGPVIGGEAEASTGGLHPLPRQAGRSVLATYRGAVDTYTVGRGPAWAAGLVGANAAVTRRALAGAGNLEADVPTGTDYHLAKSLVAARVRIRQVRTSRVATAYPETVSGYVRQQRRWLRNVALLGRRFGDVSDMARSLTTSLLAVGMLVGPAAAWWCGPAVLSVWAIAILHASLSKARYCGFAALADEDWPPGAVARCLAAVVPLTFVELVAGASPLLDYAAPWREASW